MNLSGLLSQVKKMSGQSQPRQRHNRHQQLRATRASSGVPNRVKAERPANAAAAFAAAAANAGADFEIPQSLVHAGFILLAGLFFAAAFWLSPPELQGKIVSPLMKPVFRTLVWTYSIMGRPTVPSIESQAILTLLHNHPAFSETNVTAIDIEASRAKLLRTTTTFFPKPSDFTIKEVSIPGLSRAIWYEPPQHRDDLVVLYFHGGGYIEGSIESHLGLVSGILRETRLKALMIDYRLAPEHPLPAAIEDAVVAYRWLLNDAEIKPNQIILMGDSAGGHLVISTAIELIKQDESLPLAIVALSPWTDATLSGASYESNDGKDPTLRTARCKLVRDLAVEAKDRLKFSPLHSTSNAVFSRLPPLLLQVGSYDVLLDDSVEFAKKAKNAGSNNVQLEVYEGQTHVFSLFYGSSFQTPESEKAALSIKEFIRSNSA
eukprot:TRINITY_DN1076_c0_g1_i1.p1 TRINITY_DN1076_c0_g1~~TRINITY_DN1076_c0_g1_i1.p1  ORF type:complete len:433 (-),score=104.88 TRINITY_DN1076_c0_g1_i1:70-1368(-)